MMAPRCLAMAMPAIQDGAFVGSLAWSVTLSMAGYYSHRSSHLTLCLQDIVSDMADIQETS